MDQNKDHYAILVAITYYPGIGNLRGPENDAEDFQDWLMDSTFGNVPEDNIELIRSSGFEKAVDPYDANPTETSLKKALNRWLKVDERQWKERVGKRLYLFFAGHGFTSGSQVDPALFTAQAQVGDTAHIAALRYARKIVNAGFFDEIVLVMDCCQDVLKASGVLEPSWNPPDRQKTCSMMTAFGAPRGRKSFESDGPDPVRGFFSKAFMTALRTAREVEDGVHVTARDVETRIHEIWDAEYHKQTGCWPPLDAPKALHLYKRLRPSTEPEGAMESPQSARTAPPSSTADGFRSIRTVRSGGELASRRSYSAIKKNLRISSSDPGAQITLSATDGKVVEEGVGDLQLAVAPGRYTASFRIGDELKHQELIVSGSRAAPGASARIVSAPLEFSSPIPLRHTSTYSDLHHDAAKGLSEKASRANSVGHPTLMVFARDSSHAPGTLWLLPESLRDGMRLQRLDGQLGCLVPERLAVEVHSDLGYVSLVTDVSMPGTFLLGTRRSYRDRSYWQEIVVLLAPGWRTEIYLDCVDDDNSGRRFDTETAGILLVPKRSCDTLDSTESRLTEVARLALLEGRLGVGRATLSSLLDGRIEAPMLALYTAYSLASLGEWDQVFQLCELLEARWSFHSADVALLKDSCRNRDSRRRPVQLQSHEVPWLARGWELGVASEHATPLSLGAQRNVGVWRMSSSLWTLTQIQERLDAERSRTGPSKLPTIDLQSIAHRLDRPGPDRSPLQQALRREVLNATESDEAVDVRDVVTRLARAWMLDEQVVVAALHHLIESVSH